MSGLGVAFGGVAWGVHYFLDLEDAGLPLTGLDAGLDGLADMGVD